MLLRNVTLPAYYGIEVNSDAFTSVLISTPEKETSDKFIVEGFVDISVAEAVATEYRKKDPKEKFEIRIFLVEDIANHEWFDFPNPVLTYPRTIDLHLECSECKSSMNLHLKGENLRDLALGNVSQWAYLQHLYMTEEKCASRSINIQVTAIDLEPDDNLRAAIANISDLPPPGIQWSV